MQFPDTTSFPQQYCYPNLLTMQNQNNNAAMISFAPYPIPGALYNGQPVVTSDVLQNVFKLMGTDFSMPEYPIKVSTCEATNDGCIGNEPESMGRTNLIVNYLPLELSQEGLRRMFSPFGAIVSCRIIREHCGWDGDRRVLGGSLGYGFVNFAFSSDAQRAVCVLNGTKLLGKTLKVSFARPSSDVIKNANLYVKNLPRTITSQQLEQIFSPFGNIVTTRIILDRLSGLPTGIGFVRFDTRMEAERAITSLNDTQPIGFDQPIIVKIAMAGRPRLPLSPERLPDGDHALKPGPDEANIGRSRINRFVERARSEPFIEHVTDSEQHSCNLQFSHPTGSWRKTPVGASEELIQGTMNPGHRGCSSLGMRTNTSGKYVIRVKHLPRGLNNVVVKSMFQVYGDVEHVEMHRDQAYVTMVDLVSALQAISTVNGHRVDGKRLTAHFC
ncbi:unnamed protein product [Notodromas monacha]|uniref:RRM domain-containing protein n=1 Tax=Notodromas monacha TaxID=399045 RepID=A0A7R9BUE2_9CRUS|nr:unnamed protein product [Notodromas monacha]CAG0920378.1 unnamed protein product [Notodromas monacha]